VCFLSNDRINLGAGACPRRRGKSTYFPGALQLGWSPASLLLAPTYTPNPCRTHLSPYKLSPGILSLCPSTTRTKGHQRTQGRGQQPGQQVWPMLYPFGFLERGLSCGGWGHCSLPAGGVGHPGPASSRESETTSEDSVPDEDGQKELGMELGTGRGGRWG
jgi:hypothetical protein